MNDIERGVPGPRGVRGDTGLRGDMGPRGETGVAGDVVPEFDEHGELLEKINPNRFTPATRRLVHRVIAFNVILLVCLVAAFWAFTNQARHKAECAAWDGNNKIMLSVTKAYPIHTPGITAGFRAGRADFNETLAERRVELLKSLGPRPSC